MPEKPNVLLLITDQQTAAAMSCAGNPWVHTPAMDSLADSGTRFDRAYCSYPLCTPARASQLSGKYPHQLGIYGNTGGNFWQCAAPNEEFVNHDLKNDGYRCVWAGKDMPPADGSRGFELLCPWGDIQVADHLTSFLREKHEKPFFAAGCFVNPHNICEYGSGKPLFEGTIGEMPPDHELPVLPANHPIPPFEPEILRILQKQGHEVYIPQNFSSLEWRRYLWAYYRMIELADEQIGRILSALDEAGLRDNTLVIFTADHGDGSAAHQWNQKMTLYEEVIRVPFILSGPGIAAGRLNPEVVSASLDLSPTIREYTGISEKENEGQSLLGLCRDKKESVTRDTVFVETALNPETGNAERAMKRNTGRAVVSGRWKYSLWKWGRNREQLIDLENDPGEMVNLAVSSRYKDVLNDMRQKLFDWAQRTEDNMRCIVPGHVVRSPGAK